MADLIDRQAAIDALESGKDKSAKGNIGGFYNAIIQNDIDRLRNLPSAQPEIIRCKDCYCCVAEKSFGKTYYYCDAFSYHAEGDLIGVSLQVSPEHFCGWAERRTDG